MFEVRRKSPRPVDGCQAMLSQTVDLDTTPLDGVPSIGGESIDECGLRPRVPVAEGMNLRQVSPHVREFAEEVRCIQTDQIILLVKTAENLV